ncbi:DUF2474 domain-containing protein [Photobacterium galatheae]|uniref:DUF2474 domain-containing protein n=1 Tax=Photobacterium galatheae TaxID=1654360 RepID=A0A066RZW6_9GAMM|nr:DUF2474 domain-containing protein [Photobacterium galatheae]KDM92938.1 hypothetical protein EA58_04065 [Photobacterium galatheae]MCM0148097.1 DUF2474 domain-containing protein [Photobacterium galatheae]
MKLSVVHTEHSEEIKNTQNQSEHGWKRWFWMAYLWAGSVLALALIASLIRIFMMAAGMKMH